jgi:hypothetical protein
LAAPLSKTVIPDKVAVASAARAVTAMLVPVGVVNVAPVAVMAAGTPIAGAQLAFV